MGTSPSICAVNNPDGTTTYIEQGQTESQKRAGKTPQTEKPKTVSKSKKTTKSE